MFVGKVYDSSLYHDKVDDIAAHVENVAIADDNHVLDGGFFGALEAVERHEARPGSAATAAKARFSFGPV